MSTNNVIGTCYVIQNKKMGFFRPTIYLNRPVTDHYSEKLFMLGTIFEAQQLLRNNVGYGVAIEVSHEFPNVNEDPKLKIVRS